RGVKLHTIFDVEVPQHGSKQSYILDYLPQNLITSWTNVNYDTFVGVGADITSAIYSTSGTQTAQSNSMAMAIGKKCKLIATWTNVAGQAPTLTGTGGFPTTTLVAGINTILFTATETSVVITFTNTAAASWGCTFKMVYGDVDIARPMRVISARRSNNATSYETPINVISREEYKQITIKNSVGIVTQIYYERQKDYGILYVWPVSDALSSDPKYTVIASIQRAINIFDNTLDSPDLPSEMYLAAIYGLADLLMEDYQMPSSKRELIKSRAEEYFNILIMTDQETTSIFWQPEAR
ncbi:MAG: hypothetical protein Q8M94_22610, partial [Ignavibacteria bacterium]|nr:hypothetical protein [Ignavibacteria bacterium]